MVGEWISPALGLAASLCAGMSARNAWQSARVVPRRHPTQDSGDPQVQQYGWNASYSELAIETGRLNARAGRWAISGAALALAAALAALPAVAAYLQSI